jgi:Chitobiase/beta-hexosaminidase C-terminal domain
MKKAVSADAPPTLWGRIIRPGVPGRTTLPALIVLTLLQALSAHAQPPQVLQRGYDANASGANLSETTLNTSNVVPGSFGLVFTLSVNDNVMAQPLYVPGVTINGTTHNVVYVATMSDTLYAFDADVGGAPLWTTNLATFENATPVPMPQFAYSGNTNIVGNLGILGTPVIDPSTNTLYTVASTVENGTLVYRLHAVDITTGTPRAGSGVVISGTYSTMTFDARNEWPRLSLVLVGNNVVFGFGALEAEGTGNLYSGWVMAYDKSALTQTGIFATETVGNGGAGVWQSGRPPVVDSAGYVYVFTGNGYTTGYDGVHNFSESVLKLNPANGLSLADWFTPSNWLALDNADNDLASSGPLLVPGTSLLVGGGKAGVLYLLNTNPNTGGLGHETPTDTGAIQEIAISQMRGGPVYWQRSVANGGPLLYTWGVNDAVKAFPFNGSTFATTPSATGSVNEAYPGGILTLSANGSTPGSGVVWATVSTSGNAFNVVTPGALYAFDAGNVATQLWNSNMRPADSLGNFGKLVPPLVANGRVYVATASQQVVVYGLISPPAATPTFSPVPGTYSSAQSVALSDATAGASIYYTTNGTTPTTGSTLYNPSNPIPVSSSMTIEAIAAASGYANSAVASGAYVIGSSAATEVSLVSSANVVGIVNNGSAVPNGGLDNDGYAYSATLLGTSLTWNGNTYMFGAAGSDDATSNATIALPAGNFTTLSLLATGVNGNQQNQVFTVNYSDGTSTNFTQSLSDWFSPQNYTGESQALAMAYRINTNGSLDNRTFYLYGYSFALNSTKTPVSLTLPKNRNVIVLAVDLH